MQDFVVFYVFNLVLLAPLAVLSTLTHGELTLKPVIPGLQVIVGCRNLPQFLSHRIIGLQESLYGLKKILYLLLILLALFNLDAIGYYQTKLRFISELIHP